MYLLRTLLCIYISTFLLASILALNEDINELSCELNDYAVTRVESKLNVFPCNKQTQQ